MIRDANEGGPKLAILNGLNEEQLIAGGETAVHNVIAAGRITVFFSPPLPAVVRYFYSPAEIIESRG